MNAADIDVNVAAQRLYRTKSLHLTGAIIRLPADLNRSAVTCATTSTRLSLVVAPIDRLDDLDILRGHQTLGAPQWNCDRSSGRCFSLRSLR